MEPKPSQMRSWKHLVSRVAPRWPPDPLQDRFWGGFEIILGPHSSVFLLYIFDDCCMHSVAACCKQKRSTSQGIIKRMQQRPSKKQLLSSCRLALKSSLANVNELSGPRQYRLRQDRCLLLRQDRCLLLRQDRCIALRQGSALSQQQTSVLSQPVLARTGKLINVRQ